MANQTIQVPPPQGDISLNVGDNLYIDANKALTFCCSIGANFSPNISSLSLAKDSNNGPYQAITAGSGKYNTSEGVNPCDTNAPNPKATTAKSVQINNPPPRPKK